MSTIALRTTAGDAEETITISRDDGEVVATIGERTVRGRLETRADGSGVLRVGDRVLPFRRVRRGDRLFVWLDGRTYDLEIVPRTARRADEATGGGAAGDLTAPMPGKILVVKVDAGDRFEAHAPIIVMESMKMEMTISAPRAGTIGEVCCAVGDLVEMGALLARITPDDAD